VTPRGEDRAFVAVATVVGAAVIAYWIRSEMLIAAAPPSIPVHFDLHGRPDRWGGPGELRLLAVIATLLAVAMLGIAAWLPRGARRSPGLINLPRKPTFLRLPPDARERVVAPMRALTALLPLLFVGLFWWIAESMAGFAGPGGSARLRLPWAAPAVVLGLVFVLVGVAWVRTSRAIRAAAAEARDVAGGEARR